MKTFSLQDDGQKIRVREGNSSFSVVLHRNPKEIMLLAQTLASLPTNPGTLRTVKALMEDDPKHNRSLAKALKNIIKKSRA